jgi:ATP-dependent exoDNAse (exonuclease V) beta subunit
MALSEKNPHERDQLLVFDEEPHIYTVTSDPDSAYTSCTTFIHHFFQAFDADQVVEKMMRSPKWPQSKYYGQTPDEIKAGWERNRLEASTAGTAMHKNIECFYNGEKTLEDFREEPDMKHFLTFYREHGHLLRPYRSEWMIFDEDLKLAGSIDYVTENEDGSLSLYDWKRSREIKRENPWQSGREPVNHLPDTNYWHYSLQLNLYRAIIERKYGRTVKGLALVVLHPDQSDYLLIEVPDLQDEIRQLFRHRERELSGQAPGGPVSSSDTEEDPPLTTCLL